MKSKFSSKFSWVIIALMGTTIVYADAPTVLPSPNHEAIPYITNVYYDTSLIFSQNEAILPRAEFSRAEITMVTGSGNTLIIQANSPITSAEHFIIEAEDESAARLVLDIYNASLDLPETFNVNLSNIENARSYEYTEDNISRIVFDMNGIFDYEISLSEDRTQIIILFVENHIEDMGMSFGDYFDFLWFRGEWAPTITVHKHLDRYIRLELDGNISEKAEILANSGFDFASSFHFIKDVYYVDGYLILAINEYVDYEVVHFENDTFIRILPSTFRNITIDRENNILLLHIEGNLQATHIHDYLENRNIFTLNGDFSSYFGYGFIPFFGDYVDFIEIVNYGGFTHFILHDSSHISSALFLGDEYGEFAIQSIHPRDLYDFVVFLDPGHGGTDPGAIHFGTSEADYVLDISNRVYEIINGIPNMRAFATRTTDVFVPLVDRAIMANNVSDLFVSIHANAFSNSNVRGTETFYIPREDESNFGISRNRVANIFHQNLLHNFNFPNRGVQQSNLSVLRNTNMPSVLLEAGFLSNPTEHATLTSQAGRDAYVRSIYNSIIQVMEEMN